MDDALKFFKSYSLVFLLILGTIFTFIILFTLRKRINIKWYAAVIISILFTLSGVLLVMLFAFMENGFNRDTFGQTSIFGAVFFEPLLFAAAARIFNRKYRDVFDVMTPCLIFTLMCSRINCIVKGCCEGLKIPGMGEVRYPTREIEIVFYIVILVIICVKVYKNTMNGRAYPLYMIGYGILRFILEFFRVSRASHIFHISHLWALLCFIVGMAFFAELGRKSDERKSVKHKSKR